MKTIKIKFVGFWVGFSPEQLYFYQAMQKHYQVVISEEPDYIICSCFGEPYEYCKYPQVRIMCSGENYIPDFNFVDYSVSLYPIQLGDRSFYMPISIDSGPHVLELECKSRQYDLDFVAKKEFFANFIAGHESENGIRGDFFKQLCEYKRVESAGSYLNNMPEGFTVKRGDGAENSKIDFQRKSKFTLCFESTRHNGFVTEKIVDAFCADTIPVYYGPAEAAKIFNPTAFINVGDYSSFEEAIEYIKKIDNDDELYLSIMNQPILNKADYFSDMFRREDEFVKSIFDQPLEKAYRRSRVYWPGQYEEFILQRKNMKYLLQYKATMGELLRAAAAKCIGRVKRIFVRT